MSLSFLAMGYEHVNRGGTARLLGISRTARYNLIRESQLQPLGLNARMSSLEVFSSNSAWSNVILFQNQVFGVPLGNFNGQFRQVINPRTGAPVFVNLTDHGFNDATRSILLVNTSRRVEFRVSFRDTFLSEWNSTLDAELGNSARRNGDPLMTWEMFPQGISHLDSNLTYLKIHQRLDIVLDWWPDYDASLTYHLFLFLDGAGRLQGHCQRWSAWVEGGIKSGEIMSRLWPKVEAGVATVNAQLRTRLAAIPALRDFYYLPGRQIGAASGPVLSGNTASDITLVAEL
jgi:hypothetical protein